MSDNGTEQHTAQMQDHCAVLDRVSIAAGGAVYSRYEQNAKDAVGLAAGGGTLVAVVGVTGAAGVPFLPGLFVGGVASFGVAQGVKDVSDTLIEGVGTIGRSIGLDKLHAFDVPRNQADCAEGLYRLALQQPGTPEAKIADIVNRAPLLSHPSEGSGVSQMGRILRQSGYDPDAVASYNFGPREDVASVAHHNRRDAQETEMMRRIGGKEAITALNTLIDREPVSGISIASTQAAAAAPVPSVKLPPLILN